MYITSDSIAKNFGEYLCQGPSRAIENVALAVGTNGNILPITPPDINSTWQLDFSGPAIQCANLQAQDRATVMQNVASATRNANGTKYTFLAWTYTWDKSALILSNTTVINSTLMLPFDGTIFNTAYVNPAATMPPVLYVAALPCEAEASGLIQNLENATFTKCELVNTTYHSDFAFFNGKQNIRTIRMVNADMPITAIGLVAGPKYAARQGKECPATNDELHALDGPLCSLNRTLTRTLSYQATFDAFSKLLLG